MFQIALSECGDGNEACGGCPKLPTKPTGEVFIADCDDIISEVEDLIDDENAGFAIDWEITDVDFYPLIVFWRKTEKEIEQRFAVRQQMFYKAHFK